MAVKPGPIDTVAGSLPPSCLGPDGKLPRESDDERRRRLESARRRIAEIEQLSDEDPPGAFEEFLRGLLGSQPPHWQTTPRATSFITRPGRHRQ